MRSRLAVAFVVLGILVVGCFAGVRALELRDLVRAQEAVALDQQADQLVAAAALLERSGARPDERDLRSLVPSGSRAEIDLGTDPAVVVRAAGWRADGGSRRLEAQASSGPVTVVLQRDASSADAAWRATLGPVAALAVLLAVLAGLAGWVLAGILARPFQQLAVAANDLARGRFDLALPRSRVPEVRAVADALERSSDRLRRRMVRDQAFLSDASHRLRTPVTGMRLELEELQLEQGLDPGVRATVDRSVRALERLDQTMTGFFAMASAGRREVDDARVPVEEVAASLETRWRARLPRRTTLRVRTEGDAGLLLAPGPVEMVLDPVLDDLCGAVPPVVELVLGGGGDQLRVRVWSEGGDTGLDGRERAARPAMVEVRERAEMLGGRCLGDPVDAELRLWLGGV